MSGKWPVCFQNKKTKAKKGFNGVEVPPLFIKNSMKWGPSPHTYKTPCKDLKTALGV